MTAHSTLPSPTPSLSLSLSLSPSFLHQLLAGGSEGEGAALRLPIHGLLYCFSDFRKSLGCKQGNASRSTLVNLNNYLLKHPARTPLH